jgi:hypothetical protein
METSVDTLRLNLQEIRVDNNANVIISPGLIEYATGEQHQEVLFYDGDSPVKGAKAVLNTSRYNVTITNNGTFLQCSVPKIVHGRNDLPVNGDQVREVIDFLQTDLKEQGVHTNLHGAKLSRLDLFKQDTFRYNFLDYVPVFSMLNGKRQQKRDYGTTYLYGNTQRELCVYDKGVEQQNSEGAKEVTHTNQVRAELRLLFHRPVMKATGMDTVTDLVNGYGDLTSVYNSELRKYLNVRIDPYNERHQYYLFSGDIAKEVNYLKDLHGGRLGIKQAKQYIYGKALYCLIDSNNLPVIIDTVVRCSDYSNPRVMKSRIERDVKELLLTWKSIPGQLKELYDELYLRFAV